MGEEKTVDQLEAEYKQLLQEKLDFARNEKEAQELAALESKKKAEYEEEFRKKYNLTATSRLETSGDKPVTLDAKIQEHQQFVANFGRHRGIPVTGRKYEDLLESLSYGKKNLESA